MTRSLAAITSGWVSEYWACAAARAASALAGHYPRGFAALHEQLPILVLKGCDLSTNAAGIDERRRTTADECRSVPRFEGRQVPFNVLDLRLKLVGLVLQKSDSQARLILNIGAIHAEEFAGEALKDGLGLAGLRIIERHGNRDRAVLRA